MAKIPPIHLNPCTLLLFAIVAAFCLHLLDAIPLNTSNCQQSNAPGCGEISIRLAADSAAHSRANRHTLEESPSRCPKLSKELLDKYAKNNTIMFTVADSLVVDSFGMNWLHTVIQAGITYWMVVAADEGASQKLARNNVTQCFEEFLPKEVQEAGKEYHWGSHRWSLTTWHKVTIAKSMHDLGFNVMHSDLDSVWFKDALDYFLVRHPEPALLISTDKLVCGNGVGDDGPEKHISPHHTMNTGFYFVRNTPEGRLLMDKWVKWGKKPGVGHDQDGLNSLLLSSAAFGQFTHPIPIFKPGVERIMYAIDGQVPISYLCTASFGHSYSYMIQNYYQVLQVPLYEVHFVWGYGNSEGKRMRMREVMMFFDPPEYYNEDNYISIDMVVPKTPENYTNWTDNEEILDNTEVQESFHLHAMALQLQQLYYGFALAMALDRVLILPKLTCYCVRNWYYVYKCRIPSDTVSVLPYTCSITEILRPSKLAKLKVGDKPLRYREHSFLENPRTSDAIKTSRLAVTAGLIHNSTYEHSHAIATKDVQVVKIPMGNNETRLSELLADYASTRILHFTNPMEAFSSFSSPKAQSDFDTTMDKLGSKWCCRHPRVTAATSRPESVRYMLSRTISTGISAKGHIDTEDRRRV